MIKRSSKIKSINFLCCNCLSILQVRKYKGMILEDLENALAEHAPAGGELASELPPLTIDGIPVSVDKMTQVRLNTLTAYLLWSIICSIKQLFLCRKLTNPKLPFGV